MDEKKSDVKSVIKMLAKRWFVDGLASMALGLFASLIIGLIISQIIDLLTSQFEALRDIAFLQDFKTILGANSPVVGASIGVAIVYGMKCKPLVIFSCAAVGAMGYSAGGPVGAYIASIVGAEIGNLIAGKTKIDIILVPFVTIVVGGIVGGILGGPISSFMNWLGSLINNATELQPIPMGIIVSVLTGMILTAPISSAAICIMLGLDGLAAGAATIGCCANMLGFAIISWQDNGIGGFIAQGLGTSMLQVPNIVKKPIIWLPVILASAVLGPIATTLIPIYNNAYGAGMGTSGLVGPINTYITMTSAENMQAVGAEALSAGTTLFRIGLMEFVLPLIVSFAFYWVFKKLRWIKKGDMRIESV